MAESKKERLKIEEEDFLILENMSGELALILIERYDLKVKEDSAWPKRYSYSHSGLDLEFVFSSMGSFTVRPEISERYKKNPPPIFYISVGKYLDMFIWEDINFTEVPFDQIPESLEESLKNYADYSLNS